MLEWCRSDLACESVSPLGELPEGVLQTERLAGPFRLLRTEIISREAACRIGKPCGCYVTLESKGRMELLTHGERVLLARTLAGELRAFCKALTKEEAGERTEILVVGLGNAELTADALGPMTVGRLESTRHLRKNLPALYRSFGCASLSCFSPGVLGQTGIETAELLRSIIGTVHPALVIAVDALAARSCARLAATVQLSDAGILPGSGVGNHRAALSRQTLGVPVLSIGIPTVVSSATLIWDALQQAGIEKEDPELARVLEEGRHFFVSPKECDLLCARMSEVLSSAIGIAFLGELWEA